MTVRRSLLVSLAATLAASASAMAADYEPPLYDPPVFIEEAQEIVPVEVGSGWYLRGDVSYAISTRPRGAFTYRTFTPGVPTYGSATFDNASLSSKLGFGGGFGYRFTDWLRADLTAERFSARFNGTTTSALPCPPPQNQTAPTTCRSESTATLTATSIMANGYVDLGTIARFTPYVGAGAGLTIANWGALNSTVTCVAGGGVCNPPVATPETRGGNVSARFTYAAMAGVAYDISNNLKLDLGYKYRRVAGGSMFNFTQGQQNQGATGPQGRDPGFSQHEIRLGLRYELW